MQKCQYVFLSRLVESVDALSLNLFIRHYENGILATTEDVTTRVSFSELGSQATLSWMRELLDILPTIIFATEDTKFYPIRNVNVNFEEQVVELTSKKMELDSMDLDEQLLCALKGISHLSSFDLCVYLNMQYYGNDILKWDLSELKQRYRCNMDDQMFTEYIIDLSMLMVQQALDETVNVE